MVTQRLDDSHLWPSWVMAILILSTDHRTMAGAVVTHAGNVSQLLWRWWLQVRFKRLTCHIYFSHEHVSVRFWLPFTMRKVNLTNSESFLTCTYTTNDKPQFFILSLVQFLFIFNQMLSIRAFGRCVWVLKRTIPCRCFF